MPPDPYLPFVDGSFPNPSFFGSADKLGRFNALLDSYSSSLDKSGTSEEIVLRDSDSQNFRFRRSPKLRAILKQVLPFIEPKRERLERMRDCGRYMWLEYSGTVDRYRNRASSCGMRICPHCGARARERTELVLSSMLSRFEKRQWRFVTLTLKHSSAALLEQLVFLRASFRRLRETVLWSRTQEYGKAIIEITYNKQSGSWHPHLHVLTSGKFVAQGKLSVAWSKASGGSPIVDIRTLKTQSGAIRYVAKYVGKSPALEDLDDADLLVSEYYLALNHKKMVISFGDHPEPLAAVEDDDDVVEPTDWQPLFSYDALIELARKGDVAALEVLEWLREGMGSGIPPPAKALRSVYEKLHPKGRPK